MRIPPHARISVDYLGIGIEYPGGFEVRLLDASLFEDMCALFNNCRRADLDCPRELPPGDIKRKIAAKYHAALKRATISSAFYFVEGYINCLASDFMHDHSDVLTTRKDPC